MSALQELRGLLRLRLLQFMAVGGLLALLAALSCRTKECVLDPDIWWHLKVGDWIVNHGAVPHTGILSGTAADRPWVAYSWGYEILLSRAYAWFGVVGVGIFGVLLTLMVSYSVLWMLRRLSGNFWLACGLAVVTCYAFLFNILPRPVFFSIILFAVVLTLVLEASRSGRAQPLYWLPALFLVWANLHIQFVYGLFVVGLLSATTLLQHLAIRINLAPRFLREPALPGRTLAVIFVACLLATCIGPYSVHLYQVIADYSKATFAYGTIRELQPIDFRSGEHFVQLFLMAAGFYAVGAEKRLDALKLILMVVASMVAFRTMRDSWFICLPAAACLADAALSRPAQDLPDTVLEKAALATAVAFAVLLIARNTSFNSMGLATAISQQYPVNAVNFVRRNRYSGPLYNTLDWGGFLIWYMPDYPVAIDGRNDLYGDELDRQFYQSQMGELVYKTDPYLREAGLVLLPRPSPLAGLLTSDARFVLVYEDRIAMVFVRH